MKFETLHSGRNKKIVIGFIIVFLIGITIFFNASMAKYRLTQRIPLVRGKISYSLYDLNIAEIKLENEETGEYENGDSVPISGYILNEENSYCEVNGERVSDTSFDYENGGVYINIYNRGTKCYLYFDVGMYAVDKILSDKEISTRENINGVLTTDTTGTIFKAEDDDGETYYFAGNPSDNYFKFGGFYWRIVRINGDGTIRLIYHGTSSDSSGTSNQIGTKAYNTNYTDNAYVGFKYGSIGSTSYDVTHTNSNESTMKQYLDTWYSNNLKQYEEYLDFNQGFCNDRQISTGSRSGYIGDGTGTNGTAYAFSDRVFQSNSWGWLSEQKPTYICNNSNDLFTHSSSKVGNKSLTNPIGLITADEMIYAGGFGGVDNTNFYLYTGQYYWTMTPYFYSNGAYVFGINGSGTLDYSGKNTSNAVGVRPVINIAREVELIGSGTKNEPYEIKDASSIETKSAKDTILSNITTTTSRTDFSTTYTSSTTGTIFTAEDDDGTSYYYAGAPTDNWVKLGNMYWRIVRINGDGSIRLIYNGTSTTTTGESTLVLTNIAYNTSFNDNMYVGYMYASGNAHGYEIVNGIKPQLDSWYDSNLASYASKIDTSAGFCNDRVPSTSDSSSNGSGGTGTTKTYYTSYIRLYKSGSASNAAPSFKCSDSNDLFTLSTSNKGNKKLNKPIGLITADEAAYAGGVVGANNSSYYLYNNQNNWTMSPAYFDGSDAAVFLMNSSGSLARNSVNSRIGVRAVINLKADTVFAEGGAGTTDSPYEVS